MTLDTRGKKRIQQEPKQGTKNLLAPSQCGTWLGLLKTLNLD
jgi:hypothetical protein